MDLQHAIIGALRHVDKTLVMQYVRTGKSSGISSYTSHGIHITTVTNDWHIHSMNIQGPTYSILLSKNQSAVCRGIPPRVMFCHIHDVLQYPITTNVKSYLLLSSLHAV